MGSRDSGNTAVAVRCRTPKCWTVYVSLRISIFDNVLVTARPLARGLPLKAGDIKRQKRDVASLTGGYVTDRRQILGKIPRYALRAGIEIAPRMLQAPTLVRRGEHITIIAASVGLEVRTAGEALADGTQGELMRVRNLLTKRIIQGVVSAAGVVSVRM